MNTFSSVFIKENTKPPSLTENELKGKDSQYLGKLILTPSMVIEHVSKMKEN